jgi:hypothetical protein
MDINPRGNLLELVMLAALACVCGWFAWVIGDAVFTVIFLALTFASLAVARRF